MSDSSSEVIGARAALNETRVDGPHVARDVRAAESGRNTRIDPPAVASGATPHAGEDQAEMLRLQAAQLAAHLQRRQAELDRREAQLNAAGLQFDQDARSARLWFGERQHELDERQERLERLERELADRQSQIAAAEAHHQSSQQGLRADLARLDEELTRREAVLEERWASLAAQELAHRRAAQDLEDQRRRQEDEFRQAEQAFAHRQATALRSLRLANENLEARRTAIERQAVELAQRHAAAAPVAAGEIPPERLSRLEQRERQLDAAEAILARERSLLAEERERLAHRDAELAARHKQDHERLEASYGRLVAALEERRDGLDRRQAELDARSTALEQLRANLETVHRETLETRLVTEELWAQLTSRIPGPALSPAIGQLRARLADHFQLLAEQLDERRARLQSAKSELAEEHGRLSEQRQQLHDWAQRRHAELDLLAARLAARQDDLDRREAACRELEDGWRAERLALQEQLGRLHAQARRLMAAGDTAPPAPRKSPRRAKAA